MKAETVLGNVKKRIISNVYLNNKKKMIPEIDLH